MTSNSDSNRWQQSQANSWLLVGWLLVGSRIDVATIEIRFIMFTFDYVAHLGRAGADCDSVWMESGIIKPARTPTVDSINRVSYPCLKEVSTMSNSGSGRPGSPAPLRKFYVRSGKISWLFLAENAEAAALRLVQNVLKPSMISGRKRVDEKLRLVDVGAMKLLAARLDSRIHISESGFTGSDAGVFVSEIVVKRWHGRIVALEQMIRSTG